MPTVRVSEIADILGVTHQRASKIVAGRGFPKPVGRDGQSQRAERIGEFWSYPQSRTFAEMLIDCEEDKALRAVVIGMLQE